MHEVGGRVNMSGNGHTKMEPRVAYSHDQVHGIICESGWSIAHTNKPHKLVTPKAKVGVHSFELNSYLFFKTANLPTVPRSYYCSYTPPKSLDHKKSTN